MSDDIQPLISGLSVCSPNPEERVPQFALIPEASFCTPPSTRSAVKSSTQSTASRPAVRPVQQQAATVTATKHSSAATAPAENSHKETINRLAQPKYVTPKADCDTTIAFGCTTKRKEAFKYNKSRKENVPPIAHPHRPIPRPPAIMNHQRSMAPMRDANEQRPKQGTTSERVEKSAMPAPMSAPSKMASSSTNARGTPTPETPKSDDSSNTSVLLEIKNLLLEKTQEVHELREEMKELRADMRKQSEFNEQIVEQVSQLQTSLSHTTIESITQTERWHHDAPQVASTRRRPAREIRDTAINSKVHKRADNVSNDYSRSVSSRIQALDAMIEDDEEEEDEENDEMMAVDRPYTEEGQQTSVDDELSVLMKYAKASNDDRLRAELHELAMKHLPDSRLVTLSQKQRNDPTVTSASTRRRASREIVATESAINPFGVYGRRQETNRRSPTSSYSNFMEQNNLPCDNYERYDQDYAHRRAVYHRLDEYYTSPRGNEPSVRSIINRATMITVEQRREPYANDYRDRMHTPPQQNSTNGLSIASEEFLRRHHISSDPIKRTERRRHD